MVRALPLASVICLVVGVIRLFQPPTLSQLRPQGQECWSGLGNATQLQRLDNLRTTYELEELVEGPGLYDIRETRAACKFMVDERYTPHFPHAMQQLYRCFSYWQASSQDPLFPKHDRYLIMFRQPILSEFFKGMIQQLRSTFDVSVVHFRHNLKVARSLNVSYDYSSHQSFAMRGLHDARALRNGIWKSLKIPTNTTSCGGGGGGHHHNQTTVRIGILDRKNTRLLQNRGAVIRAVERALRLRDVQVQFRISAFEDRTFAEQVEFLAHVDILVSPHGAQLTGLPLMPNCASVLELFPAGFQAPYFYGSLAAVSGVSHSYLYLGGRNPTKETKIAMKTLESRTTARAGNVCPHAEALARAVVQLVHEWQECCHAEQQQHL